MNILEDTRGKCHAQLYLIERVARNGDTDYVLYKTQVSESVSDEFVTMFRAHLQSFIEKDEHVFVPYDPTFIPENHAEFIPVADVPSAVKIMEELRYDHELDFPEITSSFLRRLWAYAVAVRGRQGHYVYFTKYSQGKVLTRKGLMPLLFHSGHFEKLQDHVFIFKPEIDCITIDDDILIFNKKKFEDIFGYIESLRAGAQRTLLILQQNGYIEDVSEFLEAVKTDRRKLRKLHTVMLNGIFREISPDKARYLAQKHGLKVSFDETGKVIPEKTDLWDFLRILNDDVLISEVTGKTYAAQSKVPLSS